MHKTLITIAILWAVSALASAQTVPVLTIDDAVALSLKGNPAVQSVVLDVDNATQTTDANKTNRLPQFKIYALGGESLRPINFDIPAGALGTYAATGPIPGHGADITEPQKFTGFILAQAQQPLSQLWKIHLSVLWSRINEDLAKQKLRLQRQDTAQSVRDLYYQIAQTQTQIESGEANEKYLAELQEEIDRKLAQQAALKADSLAVRAQLSQQRYQLVTLRDTSKTQKESLNRLLGRDIETEFSVETQPLPRVEEIELAAAHEMALRQRPEIEEAHLQAKQAETQVRLERAEYIPDISASFTYAALPNVSFAPQNFMNAGFSLQWQPFDWGQKRHKTRALQDSSKQAAISETDSERQVLVDVNTEFRTLSETRMLLDTSAVAQEAQREKLREVTNQYREKAALLADVLQQEGAVAQANANYQSALAGFWRAKASFDRALGRE